MTTMSSQEMNKGTEVTSEVEVQTEVKNGSFAINTAEFAELIWGRVILGTKTISKPNIDAKNFGIWWEEFWKLNAQPEMANIVNGTTNIDAYVIPGWMKGFIQPQRVSLNVGALRLNDVGIKKEAVEVMSALKFNVLTDQILGNRRENSVSHGVAFDRPSAYAIKPEEVSNLITLTGSRVAQDYSVSDLIIVKDDFAEMVGLNKYNFNMDLDEVEVFAAALQILVCKPSS